MVKNKNLKQWLKKIIKIEVLAIAVKVLATVVEVLTIKGLTTLVFPEGRLDVFYPLPVFVMRIMAISEVFLPPLEFTS